MGRSRSSGQSLAGHVARPTPSRRERPARCACKSGGIPTSPATWWRRVASRRSSRPEPTSAWPPTHPRPGGASDWRRGSPALRNPLFARVVVNRLWQAHFGSGLVETSSDLGFNGGFPSHPELLDWLAAEMVAQGWSIKAMHRLIVTSAAYRQSSRLDPKRPRTRRRRPPALAEGPDAARGRDGSRRDARGLGQSSTRSWAARASATRKSSRPRARRPCCMRRSTRDAGARPPDPFPRLGSRRPKPVARRLRLPRSVDHRAPPRRHDHAASGPLADEQRPGPPSVRRLRRTVRARGGPDAGRQVERAYRLAFGAWPRARRAGAGRATWSSDSGRPRSPGRSSTATNSSTSIERPAGRPSWIVATFSRGSGTAWPARPPRRSCCATASLQAGQPGEASPRLSPLRAQGDASDSHLPVRGDEPCRYVRLQAGPDRGARPVAQVVDQARRLLRPGRPAAAPGLGVSAAGPERPVGLGAVPAPGRGGRRADA